MHIITQPSVFVISTPQFHEHPTYKIPDDGDDIVKLCAFSAKGCYDSFGVDGRQNSANQLAILEHRHGSVLEHAHISIWIEGVSRGLTLELNRHRTFNISQRSTRYTAEEEAAIVLDPYYAELYSKHKADNLSREEDDILIYHLDSAQSSINYYKIQVDQLEKLNPNNLTGFDLRKWARGKARNLLPHALETRGVWTNNIRGWRWLIESRADKHAEPEIRRLADLVCLELKRVAPLYFNDFVPASDYDGITEWKPTYSKV